MFLTQNRLKIVKESIKIHSSDFMQAQERESHMTVMLNMQEFRLQGS